MTNGLDKIMYKDANILILGSLPSEKSIEQNEYYVNPTNQFWRILSKVFESNEIVFKDYVAKNEFLEKHNVALWDVIKCANRKGSLDKNIKNEEYNDILNLIDEYGFSKIFVNGKKAEKTLKKYFKLNNIRDIEFTVLPSSSAANTRYTLERKIEEWRKYILDK